MKIELSKEEAELVIQIIENLDTFVSDDDAYEMNEMIMPSQGLPNFKEDTELLFERLKQEIKSV